MAPSKTIKPTMAKKSVFTSPDVEHLSKLASLPLTDEQKEKFSAQLSNVLDFFGKLQEANTENVEPFLGAMSSKPLREDNSRTPLTKQEALSNSRYTHNDLFVVDQVLPND